MLRESFSLLVLLTVVTSHTAPVIEVTAGFIETIGSDDKFHYSLALLDCSEMDLRAFSEKGRFSFLRNADPSYWFFSRQREIVINCFKSDQDRKFISNCGLPYCPPTRRNIDEYNWRHRILFLLHPILDAEAEGKSLSPILKERRDRISKIVRFKLFSQRKPSVKFTKVLLLMHTPPDSSPLIESRNLNSESVIRYACISNSDKLYGYPELSIISVEPLSRRHLVDPFNIPKQNYSQNLFFESAGITLTPGGRRVIHVTTCQTHSAVNYVHVFDSSAVRLAVPKQYHEVTLVSLVFTHSAWILVVGAILPSAFVCLYVTVLISHSKDHFSCYTWFRKLDIFCDTLSHCVMRFEVSFKSLNTVTKIVIALVMLFQFLLLNILQGEMMSFAKESRIPSSGCRFADCLNRKARTLVEGSNRMLDHFKVWQNGAAEPAEPVRTCDDPSKIEKAFHPVAMQAETVLALLFLGYGLCGKNDFMKIKANSIIKGSGLLLEEKIKLKDSTTQLCADIYIPRIVRRALEQSLFSFTHYGRQKGFREEHDEVEASFWASDDPHAVGVKTFLSRNVTYQKELYERLGMWPNDKKESVRLDTLWRPFAFTLMLVVTGAILLALEIQGMKTLRAFRQLLLLTLKIIRTLVGYLYYRRKL